MRFDPIKPGLLCPNSATGPVLVKGTVLGL